MRCVCVCQAAHALLIPTLLSLVCEEDGTEVDSDEFLMALPDNTVLMALEPKQAWRPHPVCMALCICLLVNTESVCVISAVDELTTSHSASTLCYFWKEK